MKAEDFAKILKKGGLIADVKGQWRKTKLDHQFRRWTL